MRIHIVGATHAPIVFRAAFQLKGIEVTDDIKAAELVMISLDTPTLPSGNRDTKIIKFHVERVLKETEVPVILSSQVEPGFCRQFECERLYHQSETLRIKDAIDRALNPEQIIIGRLKPYDAYIHKEIHEFCSKWRCPIIHCSYEEAEFAKIAINVTLAHQVSISNCLAHRAAQVGCNWEVIEKILKNDRRIGQHAYTTPGDWRKSPHLLRDYYWFNETGTGNSATADA